MKKETTPKKIKTPWPTQQVMQQVYALNLWGKNDSEFYSGEGSHHPDLVNPYIDVVKTFLKSFKSPLVVCDLGCGDFNIGKQLVKYSKQYIALDIVPELIAYNASIFKADNLQFKCVDIATDNLPKADIVIIRQVLQHLSNKEIHNIVKKLSNYKYIIITEHLPEGDFIPNKDIISGQGIRLKKQSGVNVLKPPFNLKVKTEKQLLSVVLKDGKGIIETKVFTMV